MTTYFKCELRNIEAYPDPDCGWQWDNSQQLANCTEGAASIYFCTEQLTPRKLLRWFRDQGYLNERSKGRVTIYDDQCGLIELQHKGTHEPLFALIGEYVEDNS